uniref:Uncharacterized protein n=1 Tax=Lutzomyia longipalpis TaxID=7200 RepID=A0A7G3B4N1_LUTLO
MRLIDVQKKLRSCNTTQPTEGTLSTSLHVTCPRVFSHHIIRQPGHATNFAGMLLHGIHSTSTLLIGHYPTKWAQSCCSNSNFRKVLDDLRPNVPHSTTFCHLLINYFLRKMHILAHRGGRNRTGHSIMQGFCRFNHFSLLIDFFLPSAGVQCCSRTKQHTLAALVHYITTHGARGQSDSRDSR